MTRTVDIISCFDMEKKIRIFVKIKTNLTLNYRSDSFGFAKTKFRPIVALGSIVIQMNVAVTSTNNDLVEFRMP